MALDSTFRQQSIVKSMACAAHKMPKKGCVECDKKMKKAKR